MNVRFQNISMQTEQMNKIGGTRSIDELYAVRTMQKI